MDKFVVGVVVGWVLGFLVIYWVINPDKLWHEVIIKEGHGEYNRTTGEFQFLPACNKESK